MNFWQAFVCHDGGKSYLYHGLQETLYGGLRFDCQTASASIVWQDSLNNNEAGGRWI